MKTARRAALVFIFLFFTIPVLGADGNYSPKALAIKHFNEMVEAHQTDNHQKVIEAAEKLFQLNPETTLGPEVLPGLYLVYGEHLLAAERSKDALDVLQWVLANPGKLDHQDISKALDLEAKAKAAVEKAEAAIRAEQARAREEQARREREREEAERRQREEQARLERKNEEIRRKAREDEQKALAMIRDQQVQYSIPSDEQNRLFTILGQMDESKLTVADKWEIAGQCERSRERDKENIALKMYKSLATKNGNKSAMRTLGEIYAKESSYKYWVYEQKNSFTAVEKDLGEAVKWYTLYLDVERDPANTNGVLYDLGFIYLKEYRDPATAERYLSRRTVSDDKAKRLLNEARDLINPQRSQARREKEREEAERRQKAEQARREREREEAERRRREELARLKSFPPAVHVEKIYRNGVLVGVKETPRNPAAFVEWHQNNWEKNHDPASAIKAGKFLLETNSEYHDCVRAIHLANDVMRVYNDRNSNPHREAEAIRNAVLAHYDMTGHDQIIMDQ